MAATRSRAAFEAMPTNKTNTYLRDLLAALGVLAPFHAELERVGPWLDDLIPALPTAQGDIIARYARWHVLRRLRHQEQRDTLTHGAISGARARIVATTRLLAWLEQRGTDIAAATQADIEDYAANDHGRAHAVVPFLAWTRRTGITESLEVPGRQRDQPHVTLSDRDRWAHVELLLHDETIRLYVRVAGLFTLLFAQPLARTCRMRAEQVTVRDDGSVTVTFDTFPIELPKPLDQLVLRHLATRGQASYASRPDRWLFPGGHPGKHLATENIRSQLVQPTSNPAPRATPRCTSSPVRSPPRSWPRCSASAPTPPSAGPPSPPATGASTPPPVARRQRLDRIEASGADQPRQATLTTDQRAFGSKGDHRGPRLRIHLVRVTAGCPQAGVTRIIAPPTRSGRALRLEDEFADRGVVEPDFVLSVELTAAHENRSGQ